MSHDGHLRISEMVIIHPLPPSISEKIIVQQSDDSVISLVSAILYKKISTTQNETGDPSIFRCKNKSLITHCTLEEVVPEEEHRRPILPWPCLLRSQLHAATSYTPLLVRQSSSHVGLFSPFHSCWGQTLDRRRGRDHGCSGLVHLPRVETGWVLVEVGVETLCRDQ